MRWPVRAVSRVPEEEAKGARRAQVNIFASVSFKTESSQGGGSGSSGIPCGAATLVRSYLFSTCRVSKPRPKRLYLRGTRCCSSENDRTTRRFDAQPVSHVVLEFQARLQREPTSICSTSGTHSWRVDAKARRARTRVTPRMAVHSRFRYPSSPLREPAVGWGGRGSLHPREARGRD